MYIYTFFYNFKAVNASLCYVSFIFTCDFSPPSSSPSRDFSKQKMTWLWHLSESLNSEQYCPVSVPPGSLKQRQQFSKIRITNLVFCCCTESALAQCLGVHFLHFDKCLESETQRQHCTRKQCVCSHQFLQAFADDLIRNLSVWLASLWLSRPLSCSVQSAIK